MDLFVINRYREEIEDVDLITQETKHLQRLKQKIQERKNTNAKFKSPHEITLKEKPSEQKSTEYDIAKESAPKIDASVDKNIPNEVKKTKTEKNKNDFKVLGINDFEKKSKVKRVLPYWLSNPLSLSTSLQQLTCKVEDQNWLHPTLKATLLSEGIINLFPVQEQVVPFVIEEHKISELFWPHDICVSAPTGSGKTLSFVLPVIQVLMNDVGRHVRALVVLPVQELATQVAKVFKKYCTKTGLKVALLSGSIPLRQEQQQIVQYTESCGWVSEVDIIVCTAGRLVEHIQNTVGFSLKHLKFLIIDEADRIMDHIQNDWLYHLDRHIKLENQLMSGKVPNLSWNSLNDQKPPPHKMLFSATLSQDPEKLEQWSLFQPKLFSAGPVNTFEDEDQIRKYTTPDELMERTVLCNGEDKPVILYHFLAEKKWNKVLCFTNAAQAAHRLTVLLNTWGDGTLKVAELSAALSRSNREEVLKKFTNSEINVLIGTDALARGIDIPFCDYVISYDLPKNIKTYIHRVGRTGRAGRKGTAITLLSQNQLHLFQGILSNGQKCELPEIKIDPEIIKKLLSAYEHAMTKTKELIHGEIDSKVKKSIALKRRAKSKPLKRKHDDSRKE